jgi:hypothetical protein
MESVHKIYQHLSLQDPPKITQIWIFGLKTNHLATLQLVTILSCTMKTGGPYPKKNSLPQGLLKINCLRRVMTFQKVRNEKNF